MTADECRQLCERWECVARSRRTSVWDRSGSGHVASPDTPDLGWRFARWMAAERPPSPSPLHALIDRRAYANIRYAIKGLTDGGPPGRWGTGRGYVEEAGRLNACSNRGPLLKAALFAVDATIETVAAALGIPTKTVEAFNDLHFNVDGRRGEIAYRRAVVGAIRHVPLMVSSHPNAGPDLAAMIEIAESGTLEEVLAEHGIGSGVMSEEAVRSRSRKRLFRMMDKASLAMAAGQSSPASATPLSKLMEQFKGEEAPAAQHGSLRDPFLMQMLQDSKDVNDDFRRRGEAAAMARAEGGADDGKGPGFGS